MKKVLFCLALFVLFTCTTYSRAETYQVMVGDTLSGIAHKLGSSAAALRVVNNLIGDTIHPGDKLVYISEKDRFEACQRWDKIFSSRDYMDLADVVCSDLLTNRIYFQANNPFPDGKGTHYKKVLMSEDQIKVKFALK